MPSITLHIANAANNFTSAEVDTIKEATSEAEAFISDRFTFDYPVDIVVTGKSYLMSTIPEDGITGRTYHSRFIIIVIDKEQKALTKSVVYETICHELSHSVRWEKLPEYSNTLFEAMIFEGLAVALEEKAVKQQSSSEPQFFLKAVTSTTDTEYGQMIEVLKLKFDTANYDYETIFYTGNKDLPRWTGYRLGYYYVKKYLNATGRSIEDATLDSYSAFTY